jgi:hypothetical protein
MRFPALINDLRIFTIMQAYKRRKAPQTRRIARLKTIDFIMFLVAGARNRRYLHLDFAIV